MAEKIFVDGLKVSRRASAPSYIIANIGIKVDEFKNWLIKNQEGEWINIDLRLSQGGNYYAELNTYNKADAIANQNKRQQEIGHKEEPVDEIQYPEEDINVEDIPF